MVVLPCAAAAYAHTAAACARRGSHKVELATQQPGLLKAGRHAPLDGAAPLQGGMGAKCQACSHVDEDGAHGGRKAATRMAAGSMENLTLEYVLLGVSDDAKVWQQASQYMQHLPQHAHTQAHMTTINRPATFCDKGLPRPRARIAMGLVTQAWSPSPNTTQGKQVGRRV